MLIYSFIVTDKFDTPLQGILSHASDAVAELADYEGDWPEKYEITVTMPPEIIDDDKRYKFHVWEIDDAQI